MKGCCIHTTPDSAPFDGVAHSPPCPAPLRQVEPIDPTSQPHIPSIVLAGHLPRTPPTPGASSPGTPAPGQRDCRPGPSTLRRQTSGCARVQGYKGGREDAAAAWETAKSVQCSCTQRQRPATRTRVCEDPSPESNPGAHREAKDQCRAWMQAMGPRMFVPGSCNWKGGAVACASLQQQREGRVGGHESL